MRTTLAAGLLGFAALSLFAQHRGGGVIGGGGQGWGGAVQRPSSIWPTESSLPLIGPIPPLGTTPRPFPVNGPYFRHSYPRPHPYYPYQHSYGFPGYGYSSVAAYGEPAPNIIVLQAPPPSEPASPPPPPVPARSDIREYQWTSKAEPEPSGTAPETFSIAMKDGSVEAADAAWLNEGRLCYVTPQGVDREVPLDSVDREVTARLNREKNIRFRLPSAPSRRR